MARKKKRDPIIEEARERFDYAREVWEPIYRQCREDLRFSDPTDPQQWPEAVKRERQHSEGGARPTLVYDQTNQFVRQVVNTARRNKPALNFLPVDDESDPRLAEVLKGLARQTEYASRAETAYICALDQATRGGLGFFILRLEEVPNSQIQGQVCAKIHRIVDFSTVMLDPDYLEVDGSDAGWGFVTETVPRKRFERLYPKAAASDFDERGWFTKDHVRIAEYYRVATVDGRKVVEHYKLTGEEILEESVFPAEFVPIFPVIGNEVWDEGKRKLSGAVRLARDAQITYNFERNAAYEAVALGPKAPWLAAVEATEGHEAHWAMANRGNLARLPFNAFTDDGSPIPPPQRTQPAGVAVGWVDLADRSKNDIQAALGMFQATVGNNPNSQSGRAVMALQDKADVGTFHYVDNLAQAIAHCGRVLTQVWPVIYDQEQVLRIIGEDDDPEFVRVDPTLPVGYMEQRGPDGKPVVVVNPTVGRYDVRATVGPAFQTRQIEAATEIGEMVNGNPQLMALLGDVWVKMRNFPESEKISRRLKAMLPPQVQQAEEEDAPQIPPQVVQAFQQAQQQIQALQTELQEARSGMAVEQMRSEARLMAEQIKAEKDRDIAELNGVVELLKQQLQPPPMLAQEVSQDLSMN